MEDENSKKTMMKMAKKSTYLPTEILSKIVKLLPPKSILRFSCIPIILHALSLPPKPYKFPHPVIFTLEGIYIYIIDLDNSTLPRNPTKIPLPNELLKKYFNNSSLYDIKIVGSCNGILCIYSEHHDVIALVNPLTGAHKTLPYWNDRTSPPRGRRKNLGFWYDSENDDYKVLKIYEHNAYSWEQHYVYIYSSKSNSWVWVVDDKQYNIFNTKNSQGTFWEGYMHWLVPNGMDTMVLRYDLRGGKGFQTVPLVLPSSIGGRNNFRRQHLDLVVVGSKLCFYEVDTYMERDTISTKTWIVEHCDFEGNSSINGVISWDLPMKECRPIVWSTYDKPDHALMVIGASAKGRDKLLEYDKLFRYDPMMRKLSTIPLPRMPRRFLSNVVLDFASFASP